MKSLVVNFFGAPSAGKSKMSHGVTYKLKENNIRCEFTGEAAKDFVWEERHLKNQKYIFAKQENRIFRLNGKVDAIISDSPLLLPFIYADKTYPQVYFDFVWHCWNTYDNINFLIKPTGSFDEVGRIHSEKEALAIQDQIEDLLICNSVHHYTIEGTDEAAVTAVTEIIKYAIRRRSLLE